MAEQESPWLAVAIIRKPHGVRGELQLALDTDRPGAVFRKGRVLEVGNPHGKPVGRQVTVEQTRPFKDGLLIRLAEVPDRNAAEAVRGHTLLIPAAEAAPAGADEVPYHVLVGSTVLVGAEPIGTVHGIVVAGGGEMLVVRRHRGPELLVPWVREMIRRVDVERREVEIDPPEGLLDL